MARVPRAWRRRLRASTHDPLAGHANALDDIGGGHARQRSAAQLVSGDRREHQRATLSAPRSSIASVSDVLDTGLKRAG